MPPQQTCTAPLITDSASWCGRAPGHDERARVHVEDRHAVVPDMPRWSLGQWAAGSRAAARRGGTPRFHHSCTPAPARDTADASRCTCTVIAAHRAVAARARAAADPAPASSRPGISNILHTRSRILRWLRLRRYVAAVAHRGRREQEVILSIFSLYLLFLYRLISSDELSIFFSNHYKILIL